MSHPVPLLRCSAGCSAAPLAQAVDPAFDKPVMFETAGMLLAFVTLGKFLETSARTHTTAALARLAGMQPRRATRVRCSDAAGDVPVLESAAEEEVDAADLRLGDMIKVGQTPCFLKGEVALRPLLERPQDLTWRRRQRRMHLFFFFWVFSRATVSNGTLCATWVKTKCGAWCCVRACVSTGVPGRRGTRGRRGAGRRVVRGRGHDQRRARARGQAPRLARLRRHGQPAESALHQGHSRGRRHGPGPGLECTPAQRVARPWPRSGMHTRTQRGTALAQCGLECTRTHPPPPPPSFPAHELVLGR